VIKVTLNVIRCRGTLQSQWSKLTDSTSAKLKRMLMYVVNHLLKHRRTKHRLQTVAMLAM